MAQDSFKHQYAKTLSPSSVDREKGIIYGVSVITEGEAKGHGTNVDQTTLAQVRAAAMTYPSGLKVVDRHTAGTDSIYATVGVLKNFRIEGQQLKADLHLLKTEEGRDKLLEMAESIPDTFGLSIAFSGPQETKDGVCYARCDEIYNAALVGEPAANPSGLFSARIDKSVNSKAMTDEQFSAYQKQCDERMSKLESAFQALADQMKGCDFASLKKEVATFSTALEDQKKVTLSRADELKELGKSIATEFASKVGLSAGVKPSPTEGQKEEPKGEHKFAELAKKHFKELKSEVKAVKAAMAEDPKAYEAFRASGLNLNLKTA